MQRRSDLSVTGKALALCADGAEGREGVGRAAVGAFAGRRLP